jgi:hypothetical protein
MMPLHLNVLPEVRSAIEAAADQRGVSIGMIARELLNEGMKIRGIKC